jgi:hypothetical protein
MNDSKNLTLQERLQGLVDLLPAFQEREEKQKISSFLLRSSPLVYQFHKAAHDYDWVQGFNWPEWKQTPEAQNLAYDLDALAQATEDQLVRLITTCIRQDKFSEGALENYYRSGLLIAILRRAAALLNEIQENRL